jgi:uncharacterized protein
MGRSEEAIQHPSSRNRLCRRRKNFVGDGLTLLDDRFDYGEIRFFTLGMLNGRVVAVSHTETDEVTRIISVRKASKNEEEIYDKESGDWRD